MDLIFPRKWPEANVPGTTGHFKALVANRMVPTLRGVGLGRVGGILMLGWWSSGHPRPITVVGTGHPAAAFQGNPASECYKDVDPKDASHGAIFLRLSGTDKTALEESFLESLILTTG